jgi:hypothetical protein
MESSSSSRQLLEGHDSDDRLGSRVEDASRRVRLVIESIRESRQSIKALRQEARQSIIEVKEIRYGMEELVAFDNSSLSEHDSLLGSEILGGSEIVSNEEDSL